MTRRGFLGAAAVASAGYVTAGAVSKGPRGRRTTSSATTGTTTVATTTTAPTTTTTPATTETVAASSSGLPDGHVDLHQNQPNCPRDASADCIGYLEDAVVATPKGGTLHLGPHTYPLKARGLDLRSRPDIKLEGAGGGKLGNYGPPLVGTVLRADAGGITLVKCDPLTMTQYGPTLENLILDANGLDVRCLYFRDVGKTSLDTVGFRYATEGLLCQALGAPGEDNAWHDWRNLTFFQNVDGLVLDGIFGADIYNTDIEVANGRGVVGRNYAQNVKFFGLNIDGHSTSVGNGTGLDIEASGAHDWDIFAPKWEALAVGGRLRSPGGGVTPTRGIKLWGGSVAAYAGTEQGLDIGPYVDGVLIDYTHFPVFTTLDRMVHQDPAATNVHWNRLV